MFNIIRKFADVDINKFVLRLMIISNFLLTFESFLTLVTNYKFRIDVVTMGVMFMIIEVWAIVKIFKMTKHG